MTAKLKLVPAKSEVIDIYASWRAEIADRDWRSVHEIGDRRAPIDLPDTRKRGRQKFGGRYTLSLRVMEECGCVMRSMSGAWSLTTPGREIAERWMDAIATETQRAETVKLGSVEDEGAGRRHRRKTPSVTPLRKAK
jgi:hypothetical protein